MCRVQRVKNTCGHINDHVLMTCHVAKVASSSFSSEPNPTISSPAEGDEDQIILSNSSITIATTSTTDTRAEGASINPEAGARTATTTYSSSYPSSSADMDRGMVVDMIQRTGFDARTGPYCTFSKPKMLDEAQGFKCMVAGCERAD
ncbi:hypothetical protein BJY04DRAFT_214930 [Aspergillus karnatakaensis]|uniref:uncharacterized protein n=1 Tax=Aspergillus karnatakaensis TaxID=1810916 RepID=UPI003CCE46C2